MSSKNNSLEAKLNQYPSPVEMLRHAQVGGYEFPFPGEYTNWRDEQEAWQNSVVIFDQSFHMTDVYFEGPDVMPLLSKVGVNTLKNFGPDKAKQVVGVSQRGARPCERRSRGGHALLRPGGVCRGSKGLQFGDSRRARKVEPG